MVWVYFAENQWRMTFQENHCSCKGRCCKDMTKKWQRLEFNTSLLIVLNHFYFFTTGGRKGLASVEQEMKALPWWALNCRTLCLQVRPPVSLPCLGHRHWGQDCPGLVKSRSDRNWTIWEASKSAMENCYKFRVQLRSLLGTRLKPLQRTVI